MSKLATSFSQQLKDAFLGLHAFNCCDTTSSFAGKGKIKPLKIMKSDNHFIEVFARLGTAENISVEDQDTLEYFVCCLYGKPTQRSVNKIRHNKVREKFSARKSVLSNTDGLELSKMPPCKQVLTLHMERANYQSIIWRKAITNNPDIPNPGTSGWIEDSGFLKIK